MNPSSLAIIIITRASALRAVSRFVGCGWWPVPSTPIPGMRYRLTLRVSALNFQVPAPRRRAVEALGVKPGSITSYGKGAVIGTGGEIEHAAAILHPRFGKPVREAVEKGDDIIPSTKKMGGPGSVLVLPITNKDSIWSFDHMDAMEISIPDAPREDEMLIAVAVADSGRPLARTRI